MQKKHIAWSGWVELMEELSQESREKQLLSLVYRISGETAQNPEIYMSDGHILWVYYEHSCYTTQAVFSAYGTALAAVSPKYPVSVYGNIDGCESGELTASLLLGNQAVQLVKRNVSAEDFEEISDICLKIIFPTETEQREIARLIRNMDYQKPYLAMRRTPFTESALSGCPQLNEYTCFRYLLLGEQRGQSYLDSLPIPLIKELWLLFLRDKFSPLEFDDARNALEKRKCSAFPWELSLHLALSEEHIKISYEHGGFQVFDQNGKRLVFDFESNCCAEKLFLKLLFPREPGGDKPGSSYRASLW